MRQARGPSPGGKGLLPPHWEEGVTGDQADSQGASLLIEEELGPQWSPPTARRTDWGSLPLQAPSRRTRGGAVPGGQQGCGWRRGAAPGRGREGAAAQRARRSGRGQPGLSGGPWGPSVPALGKKAGFRVGFGDEDGTLATLVDTAVLPGSQSLCVCAWVLLSVHPPFPLAQGEIRLFTCHHQGVVEWEREREAGCGSP